MALVLEIIKTDGTAWIEIAVAFAAYFLLSFLWWGPLFGRLWGKQMGMAMDQKPSAREMAVPLLLQAVGTFLLAYVLWHVMIAFTVDLDTGTMTNPTVAAAMQGVFFTWLGFFVPVQLGRVAWEKASWTLFGINAGGHLVGLVAMGLAFSLL